MADGCSGDAEDKGRKDISSAMGLFGKTKAPDPKEQVQEWSRKIRKEGHQLDRQVRVQINGEMGAKCHVGFFHYRSTKLSVKR